MAQFTKYSWNDASAPQLTGAVGSLIAVLDFALVTGQSWTHPVATSGNIASYKQATGAKAGFGFVLNDNGPNGSSTYKEAWVTGWKTVTGVGASVGSGTGQFPTAAQLLTTGHAVIRKSATADSVVRPWIIYADGRTFYLFVKTGDTTATYYNFGFGEFYSLFGAGDTNNCLLNGRIVENSAAYGVGGSSNGLDLLLNPIVSNATVQQGRYFADNNAGSSGSQIMFPCGDISKTSGTLSATQEIWSLGNITCPNQADNSIYLAPITLMDSTWLIRGRYRGLYHVCHLAGAIADGSVLSGTGAYVGKTFTILAQGGSGTFAYFCIETSNTLDTN